MRVNIRLFYIMVFILSCSLVSYGQMTRIHEQYRFNYLTVDEGLSNNRVRGLIQDKYGFIWIGTRTGIGRYDGYTIKSYDEYYMDTNKYNFTETRIGLCDSRGTVWFGGAYGVCFYNMEKDRFEKLVDDVYPDRIIASPGLDEDKDSILWFTNNTELVNYNPQTGIFGYIVTNADDPGSLPPGILERLLVDNKNNIWIGYQDNGAAYFDRELNKFTHFKHSDDPSSIGEDYIERIYMDDDGVVWFGHNNNGISRFSWDTRSFSRYFPDPEIKESGRVRDMLKDPKGNFWIGAQSGLYLFNEADGTFLYYAHGKHPISVLSHNSIQLIHLDNQEGLWLGTFAGGVSFTNLNTSGFVRYDYSPFESPYFLNDKNVYSLAVDKIGNVWAGTENGGLNYLDRKTGKFTYFIHDPANYNSPVSNNIKEILVDDSNNIWFCMYKGGFSHLNTQTGTFTHYMKSENNPDGFPEQNVYTILFDPLNPHILWTGTLKGLYFFDIGTRQYIRISKEIESFENSPDIEGQVFALESDNHTIYIGTNRFIILDLDQNSFKAFASINGNLLLSVNFILVDKKGNVWFDINNELLVRMDKTTSAFAIFGHKEGLPNIRLLEACDDRKGNLWISSNRGLFQFENLVNNQDTLVYKSYDKSDNLQSQEFLYHSKAESEEGEIFFGGINGFNSFFPGNVVTNPYPPSVHIVNIKVANEPVDINERVFGRVLLRKPMLETKSIRIHHKIKVFTLEFAGLHYVAPENNQFKFIMEGYDDHWNFTDASVRFATYSNMPAGTYYFKVYAANNNGKWSEEPAILKIKVVPPFWKTWWFYLLIGLLIIIAVVIFIRLRETQLKKDKETLELKLKQGEEELNKRKTEIEKQKNALEEKERSERVQKWFNQGLAKFSDILSKEKNNLALLSQQLISTIVHYVEASQGGLFLVNEEDEDNKFLELVAHYAYNKEKLENKIFYPGEGQVGVCFKSKEIVQTDNLPDSYSKMSSGLGQGHLTHLLFIPLKRDDTILGVIELASFGRLEEFKTEFLEKLSESIVSVIATVKSNTIIQAMLQKSQLQAEQLQAQEEEMRQNMEEMKATQEEADRREQKLLDETMRLRKRIDETAREDMEKDKKINELKKKK